MAIGADERRIIELVLKATGDRELKRIQSELSSLRTSAEAAQASLSGLSTGFANVGKLVAGLGIGTLIQQGLSGIVSITQQAVEEMDALATQVQKTGIAAGDLQKLQYAAQLSNVEIETLNKGMTKLAVNMADIGGKGSAATKALREMGVTASTGLVDAMKAVADEFAKMPDGAEKTAKAIQLFGKSGADLIPLLNEGAEGIAELTGRAEELGLVLGGETLAGAAALDDALTDLGEVIQADINKIVGGMAPALVTLIEMMTGAAVTGEDFTSVGEGIGDAIIDATGALARCITVLTSWAEAITLAGDAASLTMQALTQAVQGNLGAADDLMVEAKAAADASAYLFDHALDIAKRREAEIHASYQRTKKAVADQGRLLDSARAGGGEGGAAGSGKGKTKAGSTKAEKLGATAEDRAADKAILDAATDQADAWFKARAELTKYIDELNRAADPTIAYAEGIERLDKAWASGRISAEAYRVEKERLDKEMQDAAKALEENSKAERDRQAAMEEQRKAMEKAREEWGFVADAVGQATYDIVSGTSKIGTAIKRMVATIIAEFLKMQALKMAAAFIGKALGVDPGLLMSASGNAFGSSGVISVPTVHGISGGGMGVAGESGPEAVMPLARTASGQLGVIAASGSANVTVNNYTSSDVGVRQTERGLEIDIIRRQLAEDVRRGGTPFAAALEQTYRVGRQASAT